ncbi:hypothetical protein NIES4071_53100 [Calothrix sp. NIES-4071]|nr:hypothetical protein NIES4071_53100 [Calothrix sp. NIES-4071]BAZ59618.1 hypothetical protein NIES4105_53050 [Calothrix sp. NIES-4105]
MLNWSYVYFSWQIVPKPLRQAAREALKVTDKQRVIAAFTKLLHTTTSRLTLRQAATELGKLDAGNKTAIAALILLLDVSKHEHTQQRIIHSLVNIGHGNQNVVQALISFLTTAPDRNLYWDTMTALGAIAKGNQKAIITLVERLNHNAFEHENDYFTTAVTLWEVDAGNKVASNALIKVLAATNNSHLMSRIADYLLNINFDSHTIIAVLSQKLAEDKLEQIRLNCAYYLAQLDVDNQIPLATLIEIIRNTEDSCL